MPIYRARYSTMRRKARRIDPKEVFDLWMRLGTLRAVQSHLLESGTYISPEGKPPSIQGLADAAWRYVIYHMDEARIPMREMTQAQGDIWDEEGYLSSIVERAFKLLSVTRYRKFVQEYGLQKYAPTA